MKITANQFLIILLSVFCSTVAAQKPRSTSSADIRSALQKLNTVGTVLYVAAHPDDENTRLLSYLAKEKHLRTFYLSLTRGDGGQNLIGKEQSEELGMIRTRELLEARNIDGAQQMFTRANDFGFSKNPEETFSIWDKEKILADVVWAIRKTRPDVIINRFPTTGEGGHGHHTASAILSVEAFDAAADPLRFPEQLKWVQPWQARRLFLNSFIPRNSTTPPPDMSGQIKLDVGTYNPLEGASYGEIAAASRSMHKSQGFGVPSSRGPIIENFKKLKGDTAVADIFENLDFTWKRLHSKETISSSIQNILSTFNDQQPQLSVPALVKLLSEIRNIRDQYWREIKEQEITELIVACAGIFVEVNTNEPQLAPSDSLKITATALSRLSETIQLKRINVASKDSSFNSKLKKNEIVSWESSIVIASGYPVSQPYWLEVPHTKGEFIIPQPEMTGKPWSNPAYSGTFTFESDGVTFDLKVPLTYKWTDPVKGELYRNFEVVPPVSVAATEPNVLLTGAKSVIIPVKVKSTVADFKGVLKLQLPKGFKSVPDSIPFELTASGKEMSFNFELIVPASLQQRNEKLKLTAAVYSNNAVYKHQIRTINYDHIPPLFSLRECVVNLVPVDLKSKITTVGYIEGAGDEVASCLTAAGLKVTILDEAAVMQGNLAAFDAIVTGIRAYNTTDKMDRYYDRLMQYVSDGGTLLVQYNTNNFLSTVSGKIGPYPFKISRDRVTVENAPATLMIPTHPLFNSPNKISEADFNDWVQERGLYFATDIAPEYEKMISWNDPGEKSLDGGLIYARKGKGAFIYTGISFFRQLPAGVPGAYRLMFNLLNGGK